MTGGRLGAPTLKPVQIRLRSATGDDMGVSGSFVLRGWCDDKMVEMTALVSTRATRSLCSATKLVNAGYSILMNLISLFCVTVEVVVYCFRDVSSEISCQSE